MGTSRMEKFEAEAKRLGATVERFPLDKDDNRIDYSEDFRVAKSAPNGGCGLEHCRCSPGLWVSAFEGEAGMCAHFGEDWERGGVGAFSTKDFHEWEKLVRFAEELGKKGFPTYASDGYGRD